MPTGETEVEVEVDVAGGGTRTVSGETYGDLLGPLDVSRHEATVVVDGQSVPTDATIADGVERVRVVRLIEGG
jgi:sulfur carrier protein